MKPSTLALVGIGAAVLVLAGVTFVAVNVLGFLDEANADATGIQMKKMGEALTVYAAKHDKQAPAVLEDANKYFPESRVPTDAWGNAFEYVRESDTTWMLRSFGKDGERGGQDANADLVYRGDEVEKEEDPPGRVDWGRVAVVGLLAGAGISAVYGVVGSSRWGPRSGERPGDERRE